ncbi:biotin-dependent carboxyltransferase family protein [Aquimarina sp. RZ0]|uniref:5-oxoprolinase subunit C family protein n=1 Tax=Aquimarina sp. RZ0 TaxID=2607730 RepID=UPI0011F3248B|nr:biotin-dependent carboxyltransferase family protein [Aquimarina sp. RZ0]KAA1242646.1 biotin-dependent carboxyltransferase family protein [Aquimarina sp. RZ0]
MNNIVEIIKQGLYTTIQDLGRLGFGKFGVPKSGAMDQRSFLLANAVLNNDKNCAVIEWILVPPILKFHGDTVISITGAVCIPYLDDVRYKMNRQLFVKKGSVLKLKKVKNGMIGFVGIKYGFDAEVKLESKSYYPNITSHYRLLKNDVIPYRNYSSFKHHFSSVSSTVFWDNSKTIKAFKGPEYELLSEAQKDQLLNTDFIVSRDRNRMAIPLERLLVNDLPSMLTSPVLPGTVQLTTSGKLIVLMRDCQTTGGYPRVLQLTQESINIIAQKRPNEEIQLKLVSF